MEQKTEKFVAVHKTKDQPMGHITLHETFDEKTFEQLCLEQESVIAVYDLNTEQHVMTFGGIL